MLHIEPWPSLHASPVSYSRGRNFPKLTLNRCQSCISEAQKYQGTLYKEKPAKQLKKSSKTSGSSALVPRKAYVEDAPDVDTGDGNALANVDAPPEAPTPPPAVPSRPAEPVNVFDFLVTEDTPNASKVSLGGSKEQMSIRADAPSVFEAGRQPAGESGDDHEYDEAYEENGYSYGTDPIRTAPKPKQIDYQTPAPKSLHNGSRESIYELDGRDLRSTDKKRKRNPVEELDINAIRQSEERDEAMTDAPAPILHSGLTGGLNRLLSKSKFPPSPEYSGAEPGSLSPVKRSKTIIAKERGRNGTTSLVKVRKASSSRRTSDESRPRKHHRSHHHHSNTDEHSERPKRKLKTIEYHHPDKSDSQQLVVYRTRAELFLSFVTKGPESETGCSINKVLKRYHREREEQNLGLGKGEEEKELWKSLRLKKNERGEIIVII